MLGVSHTLLSILYMLEIIHNTKYFKVKEKLKVKNMYNNSKSKHKQKHMNQTASQTDNRENNDMVNFVLRCPSLPGYILK